MQAALQTSKRLADLLLGPDVQQVQARHPPATLVSVALGEAPPNVPLPNSAVPSFLECEPTEAFGDQAQTPWCSNLTAKGLVEGDGLLPAFVQSLPGPGWDRAVKVCCVLEASFHLIW